jgi:hypothetical protein
VVESVKLEGLLQLFTPIFGLVINILVQILVFRAIINLSLLKSLFFGFGVGGLGILSLQFYLLISDPNVGIQEHAFLSITNLIIYALLGYCYFHFANLGETARRIRLVRELNDFPNGLNMQDILERYNAKMIVDTRLNRLINNDQIYLENGKYFVRPSLMLMVSKVIVLMKYVILGKKSEFD